MDAGVSHYNDRCEGWHSDRENTNELWEEIKEKVKSVTMKESREVGKWSLGKRPWHNGEWKKRKREVRRCLRQFRKNKVGREEFVKKKKEYREWCKIKGIKHREKEERWIGSIRTKR